MNRADFMKNLAGLLVDVPLTEREAAIQYYNDYFDDAGAENEQGVIASLGSPEQLASAIKAGLADGGNMGEFTEKGFSGYEKTANNEIIKRQQFADGSDQNSQYTGAAGGDGQNSNPGSGWNGGQNGGWSGSQGGDQNGGWNGGQSGNQNGAWNGNQGSQSGDYAYQTDTTAGTENKKQMSAGAIVLIIILCIFASPVLIGAGGGLLGLFGGLFGVIVGFGAAAVSLLIVGVCLFVYGIGMLFGAPLGGLCLMGAAMICAALGLLFLWITVIICGVLIPAIVRGIVKLFQNIFHTGGVKA